jgi:hypothetical protein
MLRVLSTSIGRVRRPHLDTQFFAAGLCFCFHRCDAGIARSGKVAGFVNYRN